MKKKLHILIAVTILIGIFSYTLEFSNLSFFSICNNSYAVPDKSSKKSTNTPSSEKTSPAVKNSKGTNPQYSLKEALAALKETSDKLGITKPSRQLTVYKKSNSELEIYTSLPDKEILLTRFERKPWGTWNIGGWYIVDDNSIPSNKFHILAGGGTDWEYVLSVGQAAGKGYTFSGGNHGKEALNSVKLLNGKDNSELDLKLNTPIKLNSVKIVENTSLAFDDALSKKYADVQRTYTISNSKIDLACDFTYTSDVYMGTSYICMFPVSKQFGNTIRFKGTGNQYSTPGTGKTLSKPDSPNYIGKERTLSVDIWNDSNPKYTFNIWIDNEQMADSFNNSLKVFYWDFNETVNKLYFSKYDNVYNKVSAGTTWNNSQGWKLKEGQSWLDSLSKEIKKIWLHFMQPNL